MTEIAAARGRVPVQIEPLKNFAAGLVARIDESRGELIGSYMVAGKQRR